MPDPPQEFYQKMAVTEGKKDFRLQLGRKGERKACRYLKRLGWNIVQKNFRSPFGEVDIIAEREDVVAFIEVKTRTSDKFGMPSEAVDARRQRRYVQAAKFYFAGRPMDCTVRFDVVEIFQDGINHIENAFRA